MKPFLHEISYDSPEYHEVLTFRDQVLRSPLGLSLSTADTAGEEAQRHFVLKGDGSILAGVIAVHVDTQTVRLRQMWVRPDFASSGKGRGLLAAVEDVLQRNAYQNITLHARLSVRGFYEKCGYSADGQVFEEVGIPHIIMNRRIGNV